MHKEFNEMKTDVDQGRTPTSTVRELLRWFGARRRRTGIVKKIQSELDDAGIITSPDFTKVWIDAEITFKKAHTVAAATTPAGEHPSDSKATEAPREASFLISMLEAANRGVISVQPQDSVEKAITLMLAHDFSQLAVMTNERTLKGTISWKTIGKRLSHENNLKEAKDAMEAAFALEDSEPLFKATKQIIDHEFVFVRSSVDQKVTGIVTATDLSEQFQSLSEPFLLIGQIENQVRKMLHEKFSVSELQEACSDADPSRREKIQSVADLTFGEYLRLFQKPEKWDKLDLSVDRGVFCDEMNSVREIRNDVMHFDPDGIEDEHYDQLRRFSRLLDELDSLGQ
ncbi:CBS domain-containing protein [Tritonibacter sp. SIMBA_163]|uniref:CBS domain-containing protein n=1 Tax=Tritonibacter sp. SIMBA_163 TaxID=3080868 RepID=UPI00397F7277